MGTLHKFPFAEQIDSAESWADRLRRVGREVAAILIKLAEHPTEPSENVIEVAVGLHLQSVTADIEYQSPGSGITAAEVQELKDKAQQAIDGMSPEDQARVWERISEEMEATNQVTYIMSPEDQARVWERISEEMEGSETIKEEQ